VMASARSAWSFSLDSFSRPGTKRFVTVCTRLCAAHLSRHGDANTNHLALCLSGRESRKKIKVFVVFFFSLGCCKFEKHPTAPSPFTNHFQYLTVEAVIFCQAICTESHTRSFISCLSHSTLVSSSRISRPLLVFNWFRTSILTILLRLQAVIYNTFFFLCVEGIWVCLTRSLREIITLFPNE
jgi:hypothetical protein